jgi:hypothetical protein
LEGRVIENVVIYYDHLEYLTVIWYNLQPFGVVCGYLEYFIRYGMFRPRKNLATLMYIPTHEAGPWLSPVFKTHVYLCSDSKSLCINEGIAQVS